MQRTVSASAFASPPPSPAPSLAHTLGLHGGPMNGSLAAPTAPSEAQVLACEEEVNAILGTLIGLPVVRKNGYVPRACLA